MPTGLLSSTVCTSLVLRDLRATSSRRGLGIVYHRDCAKTVVGATPFRRCGYGSTLGLDSAAVPLASEAPKANSLTPEEHSHRRNSRSGGGRRGWALTKVLTEPTLEGFQIEVNDRCDV